MTRLLILLYAVQKEKDINIRNELKKERHELVFRIQWNIYDGAFLQKWLTAKSFIVGIRPGSK